MYSDTETPKDLFRHKVYEELQQPLKTSLDNYAPMNNHPDFCLLFTINKVFIVRIHRMKQF